MKELEIGARNGNEGSTIKDMQGVGDNNMSNAVSMEIPQIITIGINNALGCNTP